MGEVVSTRDGGAGPAIRLALPASVAGLRGWGVARTPKWPVRLELRDPGILAIVRPRRFQTTDVMATSITWAHLKVNSAQYETGGGYIGGGSGIVGAATGIATAAALNRASRQRWEQAQLRIIEHLPTGATRSVSLGFSTRTPASLLELLSPALDSWAAEWVRQTLAGEIQPFRDPGDLDGVYHQIDLIAARGLITPHQRLALASHQSQRLVTTLQERLTAGHVEHDELPQLNRDLDDLLDDDRITREQARTLRRHMKGVPTPEVQAENALARQQLITELIQLRQTGAITEQELQNEIARLQRG